MGSLQSAVLGFGLFKSLQRFGWGQDFTVAENVIVQTTAVATATMPLAAGLVGVVPAMVRFQESVKTSRVLAPATRLQHRGAAEHPCILRSTAATWELLQHSQGKLTVEENPPLGPVVLNTGQLLLWSVALAFFGVFIAVPLRTQTILM